jgi:preprotein translocase subunit SecE
MKKIFRNFNIAVFFWYAILFGVITLIFDLLINNKLKDGQPLSKYLVGYFLKVIVFSLIMSLFFGKKKDDTKNNE